MKLATLNDGSRDGQLAVVSRDLSTAHFASGIAGRLQQVLDDWNFLSPQLEDLYQTLNGGKARHAFAFDPRQCLAPLPRAFLRVDGTAHPHLRHVAGDDLQGPCDDVVLPGNAADIDCTASLAVLTGDVARGTEADAALDGVRMLVLLGDWRLTDLPLRAPSAGDDRFGSTVSASCAPVAVTPDELGGAWQRGRVQLDLTLACNGRRLDSVACGPAMPVHFGELIAQAAQQRRLGAGSLVGHAVAHVGGQGAEPARLSDRVRIEMMAQDGQSVFGAIDRRAVAAQAS